MLQYAETSGTRLARILRGEIEPPDLELIEKLKNTPKINGVHLMAVHWESIVPRLVTEAGLAPRFAPEAH